MAAADDCGISSSVQALLESLDDASDLLFLPDVSDAVDFDFDADASGPPLFQVESSLFAACSSDSSSSGSPATVVVASSPSGQPKSRSELPRQRNSYREKVKQEIRFLRARAAELTANLAAQRTGRAALTAADRQLVGSWWKRIALNQLRERRESEAENTRLKRALRSHQELSANLQRALARRLDPAFVIATSAPPRLKRARTATMWEDSGFAVLAGGLDAAFERFDAVMKDSGMADGQGGTASRCQMKTCVAATGEVTPFMELTNATISPFGPRETSRAVWQSLVEQFFHRSSGRVKDAWRSGNTIAAHVRSKHTLQSKRGDGGDGITDAAHDQQPAQRTMQKEGFLNFTVVLRKYIDEESRMVLVWRARNEAEGELADVYVDETGWALIQPAASVTTGNAPCIGCTCVHLVQRHRATQSVVDVTSQTQHPSASALADLVVSSNKDDISAIVDAVESMLLADVRACRAQARS